MRYLLEIAAYGNKFLSGSIRELYADRSRRTTAAVGCATTSEAYNNFSCAAFGRIQNQFSNTVGSGFARIPAALHQRTVFSSSAAVTGLSFAYTPGENDSGYAELFGFTHGSGTMLLFR